ncbi:MAG: glycosyltransferase [Schaedlerella sp.]|nr:glycosyltransferase [Lachnospiraceae bacterium]MDY4203546.1 glycosyltransferase [Schaedlerella sp.]
MNPTVSIIVPVYNAEKYLHRCIDSILNQEFGDFELLLMDDGSTDSSGAICDEYAEKDSRIRVFHKENTGVSDTRNMALDNAEGTYLQFLDSDDWITSDATRLFVRTAQENNCDLVISDFYRVVGERLSRKGDIEDDAVMSLEEFASHMMENPADFYYGVLWNKLYRRDIVETWHLRMASDISWCEDFMFNLEYIRHAERFCALQAPLYYYVKTKGSLISQSTNISNVIKMKLMVFEYYDNFYRHILNEEDYEKNRLSVYRFLVDAAGDGNVPPFLLGAKKLGEERNGVCSEAVAGEGILMDAYRDRKLLEHYQEVVALKYDLTLDDTKLLLYLSHPHSITTRKELADFTNISRIALNRSLQRLTAKGVLKIEDIRVKKSSVRRINIQFQPAADAILADLSVAQSDYDNARFADFTEEELEQYAYLSDKIKENIQRVLQ